MNKKQFLKDLEARTIRVIKVEKQEDPVKEEQGVISYVANALVKDGDRAVARNIGFYVVDEGKKDEEAFYRDKAPESFNDLKEEKAFLKSLPYKRLRLTEQFLEEGYSLFRAFKEVDGSLKEVQVMVCKDDDGARSYKEII